MGISPSYIGPFKYDLTLEDGKVGQSVRKCEKGGGSMDKFLKRTFSLKTFF